MKFADAAAPRSTVLVVDDFEPFRCFISSTIRKQPNMVIVGEARDGLEAVRQAETLQPDLVVLDIGLPKMNGIQAARRIREVACDARIVFLSQELSLDVVREALSAGAWGYVIKTEAETDLVGALGDVVSGKQFVSKELEQQVSEKHRTA